MFQDGTIICNSVEKFEPFLNSWSLVASMNTKRESTGMVELGGCLYIVGGTDGGTDLSSVERYDPRVS